MDIQEIHKKLDKQCPSDYKINEIIQFAYPYRRVRVNATVNKSPEKSIQQVYSVFIRTIKAGYNKEVQIIKFLGLNKEDFILRELYFLRERGFVDFTSGIWLVTEKGEEFVKDNSILKILEEEEFEFLIDAISNRAIEKNFRLFSDKNIENRLNPEIDYSIKNPELLKNKNEQLSDIYKSQSNGKAYLVDYDKSNIKFDKKENHDYYLIEYIPIKEKESELEPYIEVRNTDKDISKQKRLSKSLSEKYPSILYQFTTSDRTSFAKIQEDNNSELLEEFKTTEIEKKITETQTLSVWETQEKFGEALKTVKSKILIESPWVKRATLKYINSIENALQRSVDVIILYGIESNDEHHYGTIEKLRNLKSKYQKNFHLIHLPTHFEEQKNYKMTGTHRKLIIKDNDYYIQGSFNFLSFNKEKGQKIANEESILIPKNVETKWESVLKEYGINNGWQQRI
ncbi:hypothetical protein SAMN04488009_2281 [Maribacter sedimenticola]|uniref:PLD-like domain-containing protein n=1 Tax=Maribacter sedimenticola TaxID=228956 RepID=A0ABY1SHL3_9FLAO|nr:hypothetical protein [Maribacter sedimenticola]SNR54388.1 hypothetical protein SAMN04488009_2281 [Maribacter sedimenticola]